MQFAVQHAGRLQGRPLKSTDEKRADLTAPLLLKFVILHSKSFTFSFVFIFFSWLCHQSCKSQCSLGFVVCCANFKQQETCSSR